MLSDRRVLNNAKGVAQRHFRSKNNKTTLYRYIVDVLCSSTLRKPSEWTEIARRGLKIKIKQQSIICTYLYIHREVGNWLFV